MQKTAVNRVEFSVVLQRGVVKFGYFAKENYIYFHFFRNLYGYKVVTITNFSNRLCNLHKTTLFISVDIWIFSVYNCLCPEDNWLLANIHMPPSY